ncbi:hypothetical protein GR247_41565, partial [Rhizobium leguminosarum]|nr:hypothetical protein [Rhizobium leguminosarum]
LNAVAQFERDLLIERTQSGLKRAKSEGKTLGRPSTLNEKQKQGYCHVNWVAVACLTGWA